jgi:polyhydroxyalkanoate synthesis regulator phasin
MKSPDEPKNNCPFIDDMIKNQKDDLEEIRSRFVVLRDWGKYWQDQYNDLESDKDKEIESLKDEVSELKERIQELENERRI